MRVALPQRTAPAAAPKPQPAAPRAAPAPYSPAPARGDASARLAATLSRLEPLPYESPVARAIQRKARAGANAALDLPAGAVVQAVWKGDEGGMQTWDSLIDGVQWSRIGDQLWYDIVEPSQIVLGSLEAYKKWESEAHTEEEWDEIERTADAPPEVSDSEEKQPARRQEARKYDVVSIKKVDTKAVEQAADAVDADTAFGGLGEEDELESVAMVRPTQGANHYEVQAIVGGVRVKLDLTKTGFRLIYNASDYGNESGYKVDKPNPIKGKTGNDLYKAFLGIALSRNYHMDLYDCEAFAEELVDTISDKIREDSDEDVKDKKDKSKASDLFSM